MLNLVNLPHVPLQRLLDRSSTLETMITRLEESNMQLVVLVGEQQDIRKLSDKIGTKITDTVDTIPKVKTLLVGNSLLPDVNVDSPDNRSQIRVVKKSGATFNEIEKMIDEAAETHTINEIVIVGGTTETMGDATADDISNEVSRLLRTAQSVAPSVRLSSVIPTTRRTDVQRRNTLNDQLRTTCEENNATFVDNDNNFTFRNGAHENLQTLPRIRPTHPDMPNIKFGQIGIAKLFNNINSSKARGPANSLPVF